MLIDYGNIQFFYRMDSEEGRKEGQRMNRRDRKKIAVEEQNRRDLEKIEEQLNQLIIDNKEIQKQQDFEERKERPRRPKEDRDIRPQHKEAKRREHGRRRKNMDGPDETQADQRKFNVGELQQLEEKGFILVQKKEPRPERRFQAKQRREEQQNEDRYRKERRYDNAERQRGREEPKKNIFEELQINQEQAVNQQPNKRYHKKEFKDIEREEKDKERERIRAQMQRIREAEREERQRIKENERAEREKAKRERDQHKNRNRQEKWSNENKSSISQKSQRQDLKQSKASEVDRQNPPQYFLCPITTVMMQSPVILTSCGHTFEETVIREWLKKQLQCPLCKRDATEMNIVKNFALAEAIRNYTS